MILCGFLASCAGIGLHSTKGNAFGVDAEDLHRDRMTQGAFVFDQQAKEEQIKVGATIPYQKLRRFKKYVTGNDD